METFSFRRIEFICVRNSIPERGERITLIVHHLSRIVRCSENGISKIKNAIMITMLFVRCVFLQSKHFRRFDINKRQA